MTQKQKDALAKAREAKLAKLKAEKEQEVPDSPKRSHKAQGKVGATSRLTSKQVEESPEASSSEEEVVVKKKKKAVVKKPKKRIVYVSDSSSEEEQVVVKKKRAPARKKPQEPALAVAYTEPNRPEIPPEPQYPRYMHSRIFG